MIGGIPLLFSWANLEQGDTLHIFTYINISIQKYMTTRMALVGIATSWNLNRNVYTASIDGPVYALTKRILYFLKSGLLQRHRLIFNSYFCCSLPSREFMVI